MDHLWSKPSSMIFAGLNTIRVTHARFGTPQSEINIDLNEFKTLYQERNREYVMGLVWHVFNYADDPFEFIQLFEYLNSESISTLTVDQICGN